jgi:hypothetical protein
MHKQMSEHQIRMAQIARFAPPPSGSDAHKKWEELISSFPKNPEIDREIIEKFKKASAIIDAQLDNGVGFYIDGILREFLLEYNGRNFKHGLRSMPASFNAMEAFYQFAQDLCIFKLYPEKEHLFSSLQFLDYATSPNSPDDVREVLQSIEDSVIYSYNIINSPEDITFSTNDGIEYAIGGSTIIRHGTEVCVLLLAGQKTDLTERTRELAELPKGNYFPGKELITPAEDLVREAVPLLGNKQFWQKLVLSRFDLETATFDVRYVLTDAGDHFRIETDDTSIFRQGIPPYDVLPEFEEEAKRQTNNIKRYDTLFELCKTALYLPLFFEEHVDDIRIESHSTKFLKRIKKKGGHKKKTKYLSAAERITHRPVSVLYLPEYQHPTRTIHKAPDIKIEVSGFWKKLAPDQLGTDKHGDPIHGRTWIEKTLIWSESTREPGTLFAKNHVPNQATTSRTDTLDKGYIYVMRSAAHNKDIFKIGLTRRSSDIRSDELSRATGVPDKFLVVQEWEVSDCVKAEMLIHQALDQYRINPDREFFKVSYKIINKVIEEIINQLEPKTETGA